MTDDKVVAELRAQVDNLIVLLNMSMDGHLNAEPEMYSAMLKAAGIPQCASCRHCLTASQTETTVCRRCSPRPRHEVAGAGTAGGDGK
jgi:hypothetical protein